jgi:transcriptional regulator GlxA family with amidase domain
MFSRSFRKNSGMTFVQYVNRQRIQRACELLINTNVSVTDVCFRVGYKNLSSFDRQFQVQKGISPRRFRRAHQGQNLYAAAMDLAAPAPVAQRKPHRARP